MLIRLLIIFAFTFGQLVTASPPREAIPPELAVLPDGTSKYQSRIQESLSAEDIDELRLVDFLTRGTPWICHETLAGQQRLTNVYLETLDRLKQHKQRDLFLRTRSELAAVAAQKTKTFSGPDRKSSALQFRTSLRHVVIEYPFSTPAREALTRLFLLALNQGRVEEARVYARHFLRYYALEELSPKILFSLAAFVLGDSPAESTPQDRVRLEGALSQSQNALEAWLPLEKRKALERELSPPSLSPRTPSSPWRLYEKAFSEDPAERNEFRELLKMDPGPTDVPHLPLPACAVPLPYEILFSREEGTPDVLALAKAILSPERFESLARSVAVEGNLKTYFAVLESGILQSGKEIEERYFRYQERDVYLHLINHTWQSSPSEQVRVAIALGPAGAVLYPHIAEAKIQSPEIAAEIYQYLLSTDRRTLLSTMRLIEHLQWAPPGGKLAMERLLHHRSEEIRLYAGIALLKVGYGFRPVKQLAENQLRGVTLDPAPLFSLILELTSQGYDLDATDFLVKRLPQMPFPRTLLASLNHPTPSRHLQAAFVKILHHENPEIQTNFRELLFDVKPDNLTEDMKNELVQELASPYFLKSAALKITEALQFHPPTDFPSAIEPLWKVVEDPLQNAMAASHALVLLSRLGADFRSHRALFDTMISKDIDDETILDLRQQVLPLTWAERDPSYPPLQDLIETWIKSKNFNRVKVAARAISALDGGVARLVTLYPEMASPQAKEGLTTILLDVLPRHFPILRTLIPDMARNSQHFDTYFSSYSPQIQTLILDTIDPNELELRQRLSSFQANAPSAR